MVGVTAKMADGARRLPKWQAIANLVPNKKYFFGMKNATSKRRTKTYQNTEKFCQNLLTEKSKDFACNLNFGL